MHSLGRSVVALESGGGLHVSGAMCFAVLCACGWSGAGRSLLLSSVTAPHAADCVLWPSCECFASDADGCCLVNEPWTMDGGHWR